MAKATTNYNAFQLILENRPIKPKKLITLKKKMENNPHLFKVKPILCNSKEASKDRYASCDGLGLGIIDGQHRFTICKELNLPIHYIAGQNWNISEIRQINSVQKSWTYHDFIKSYMDLEKGVASFPKLSIFLFSFVLFKVLGLKGMP